MKKTLLTAFALLTLIGTSAKAENRVEHPLWDCMLTFEAEGGGLQILIGHYKLTGAGTVTCVDLAGNRQDMDVKVTFGGSPISPNISFGSMKVAGVATGIGLASRPEALLGKYYAVSANAAVILGTGANFAVRGGEEAVTLNVGLSVARGAGLQLGVNRLKIEAAE